MFNDFDRNIFENKTIQTFFEISRNNVIIRVYNVNSFCALIDFSSRIFICDFFSYLNFINHVFFFF